MSDKIVYQLNDAGVLVGETVADESPLEPGVFLIPGGCVEMPPPQHIDGKLRVFRDDAWHYIDEELAPTEPAALLPTLEELKAAKLAQLKQQSENIANAYTAAYPDFEKLTWDDQRREALAWAADNSTPTPYIDALAENRELDRIEYLNRTVFKVTAFTAFAQKLVGQRQKFEDKIKAIKVEEGETDEEAAKQRLDAIAFVFTL